ncbi:MAG TPA: 50S ribosomal protein L11 methyltransferase [Pseudogracilibacillus sp.]|nr:50S ribosomal protein L11 methyltransferase [Pseudogracilibacillus sp.]
MNWNELSIHTTNEAVEPISNILNEAGANGVVIEDPVDLTKEKRDLFGEVYALDRSKYPKEGIVLKSYFIDDENWPEKKQMILKQIEHLQHYHIDLGLHQIATKDVKATDWENEWKKYFKPVSVTERFTIVPSWEDYTKKTDRELIITIDPGMAFGTGTHPTTVLSLKALEETVRPNDLVIDVGAGSGILSIAASLLGAKHVYSYDLDEIAVSSTTQNCNRNDLQHTITAQKNDLLKGVNKQANVIVSNILADILLRLVDDAWDNLLEGGYFITSGIINSKQMLIKDKLVEKGFHIIKQNQMENWISIIAQKHYVK